MPLFYYEAFQENGERVRGTVEAISAQAARAALRQDDLEAEELHEATMEEQKELAAHMPPQAPSEPPAQEQEVPPAQSTEPAAEKSHILEEDPPETSNATKTYYPFIDTLRLYAGWLLAWYALVYVFGSYQYTKETFVELPYVEALLPPFSPIVFDITVGTFLFLLLTSVYRAINGGRMRAFSLLLLGVILFALYRLNV